MLITLNHLSLTRPLLFVDAESTGVNTETDRIIALALIRIEPHGAAIEDTFLFDPTVSIPLSSSQVHGLTNEDVAGKRTFGECAPGLIRRFDGCDIAGFGVARFDLPLLVAEFRRAGIILSLEGRAVVDAQTIYHAREPRTLSAAVQFYCGAGHPAAHDPTADAWASVMVLDAQVGFYRLPPEPGRLQRALPGVDAAGRFRRVGSEVVFSFGKHSGKAVEEVAVTDRPYLEWLVQRRFLLEDALAVVRAALPQGR
jgi:DNA polymerase-3 subunit epsilon